MSAPVDEKVWTSGDANPPPAADAAQDEPIATEPLERVGTERELNEEKVLDKEYVQQKNHEHVHQKHGQSPLNRQQSDWTSSSSDSQDDKSEKNAVVEKQTWAEKINPLKRKHKPPVPTERSVSREYKANFFSQLTFQWMAPLMSVSIFLAIS